MNNKLHKYDVKLYILTKLKLLYDFIHIQGIIRQNQSGTRHTAKVVTKLMQRLFNQDDALYLDYISCSQAEKTYCTSTLRSSLRDNQKVLKNWVNESKNLKKWNLCGKLERKK